MRKLCYFTSLFPKSLLHSKIYIYLGATPGNLILFLLAQMSHPLILFKKITHKHRKTQMHLFCTLRPGLKSVKRVLLWGVGSAPHSEKERFSNFSVQFNQLVKWDKRFDDWDSLEKILKANNLRISAESRKKNI